MGDDEIGPNEIEVVDQPQETPPDDGGEGGKEKGGDPAAARLAGERDDWRRRAEVAERNHTEARAMLDAAERKKAEDPDAIATFDREFAENPGAVYRRERAAQQAQYRQDLDLRDAESMIRSQPEYAKDKKKFSDDLATILHEEYPDDPDGQRTPMRRQIARALKIFRMEHPEAKPDPAPGARRAPGGGRGGGTGEPAGPSASREPSDEDLEWATSHFHDSPKDGMGQGQWLMKAWRGRGWM